MLPPVNSSILAEHPKFDALYRDLCDNKLHADGSSQLDLDEIKERKALQEELYNARVEVATRDLVLYSLRCLAHRNDELPEDLKDLSALAATSMAGKVDAEDWDVVEHELQRFRGDVARRIVFALSIELQQDATTLSHLLDVNDPPRIEELPARIRKLQESIDASTASLAQTRLEMADVATQLHATHRSILTQVIHLLEQTIHGVVSRHTRARAEYLATVAEGMCRKLAVQQGQLTQQVYTPEMREWLRVRSGEIDRETTDLKRRIRGTTEELEKVRAVKGLESIAEGYAEVLRETRRIEEAVAGLESGR